MTLEICHMHKCFSYRLMEKLTQTGHTILELSSENAWYSVVESGRFVISGGVSFSDPWHM